MFYTVADKELMDMGARVKAACHTELDPFEVFFIFRDVAAKSHGKPSFGKPWKPKPLETFLMRRAFEIEPDFLIEVPKDIWDAAKPKQREAMLDHLLSYATNAQKKGNDVADIRAPDLVTFAGVVTRRGAWNADLRNIKGRLDQHELPLEDEGGEETGDPFGGDALKVAPAVS